MTNVEKFIEFMEEDNWIFAEGLYEQDYSFTDTASVEQTCEEILEEDVLPFVEEIVPIPNYIPEYPNVNRFLVECKYWAELQAPIWAGIKDSKDPGVQALGERMVEALLKLQGVEKIEDLGLDT